MSTTEPFLPFTEPGNQPDARERDVDRDVDILPGDGDDAAGATQDGDPVRAGDRQPAFRTPHKGDPLTPESLAEELKDASEEADEREAAEDERTDR